MYRWNSRNNTSGTRNRSNLSESTSTSVISAKLWIGNVFKAFFSLLSILQCRRVLRKVNPINCLSQQSISCTNKNASTPLPFDGSKSSSINNCNISGCNDIPQPRKMTQILSKTMGLLGKLLGVAFLIHFIIMSTFAEREGYVHGYGSDGSRHHYTHRSQRSYRNEKHTVSPEDNTLAPFRTQNKSEAVFFTENSTIITAQIGSETYLPCAVRNLGSGVASWIRRRDYTLLTVGMGTYSNDVRFWVVHNRAAQSWELHIKPVKESDEGLYECQISTHPPSNILISLTVIEAKAEILGEPDKHVRSGSTFELVCVLRDSTEPPVYVFWFHNEKMINYDVVRGVVVNSDSEKSILTIQDAKKTDSGNYSCVPSNAKPTSISVHILNGEKPAAMQHGSRNDSGRPLGSSFGFLFVTTVAVFVVTAWLLTADLNRNLCYLRRKLDVPPLCASGNLQLVHIPQPCKEFHPHHPTWTIGKKNKSLELRRVVYEEESACADKVDMRLGAALREEKLCPILSTSRVYILEISYHQNHTRNNRALRKTHAFLSNSTSNRKVKNVTDVGTLSHVVVNIVESRSDIINSASHSHHPFPTRLGTNKDELPLDNFSPSLSSDSSLVPIIMSNAKLEPTTFFSSPKVSFHTESLFKYPESELKVGHTTLISSR